MNIAQSLLPEFEQEMAGTRKTLERIPDDKLDWKAHPKSNSIGWVAAHLAEIPGWVEGTLTQDSWDLSPPGGEPYQTPTFTRTADILKSFDANVASAKKAIAAAKDPDLFKPWSLLMGGNVLFTMPRIAVLRTFVLSHTIHHRAHLCVYLRLNDIPVPALYGPSGDEQGD
ncbi:MAG: DinB family protein [Planctomycetota bacterium]